MSLTPEQQCVRLAEFESLDLHVIVKLGAYYRPNAAGYTYSIDEAWKLPYAEAKKYEMYADRLDVSVNEKVTIQPVPAPNYLCPSTGLSHLHRIEERLTDEEWRRYRRCLRGMQVDSPSLPDWADIEDCLIHATAAQRREAILRALNLWEEEDTTHE